MPGPFDPEYYDYTAELDDSVDEIQFGKYKGKTPAEVLAENPGYICWATNATHHWVGSEEVVARAFKISGVKREKIITKSKPQSSDYSKLTQYQRDAEVAAFESAMYEAFGEYPLSRPQWKKAS